MPQDFERTDNLHRAPLLRQFTSTAQPLIVTPTFVSRVDDTPRGDRPQDEGSARNRRSHGVRHPNWHPGALALEPDPNLAHEHWDEYWRKVHGPKFAWDEPGSSSELVLRYDQLHCIASGPSSFFPPPYHAMVDESEGRKAAEAAQGSATNGRPDGFLCLCRHADRRGRRPSAGSLPWNGRLEGDGDTTGRRAIQKTLHDRTARRRYGAVGQCPRHKRSDMRDRHQCSGGVREDPDPLTFPRTLLLRRRQPRMSLNQCRGHLFELYGLYGYSVPILDGVDQRPGDGLPGAIVSPPWIGIGDAVENVL